jgi:hypothetical protein
MKALILDGSSPGDLSAEAIKKIVVHELKKKGEQVKLMELHQLNLHTCRGGFFCWIRTPGICDIADDNRKIAQEAANCDRVVFLSPILFGGYSPVLKVALDHLIQNISPDFIRYHGETHHKKRYARYPDLTVMGWLPEEKQREEEVFRHLVWRNGLNFHSQETQNLIFRESETEEEWKISIERWAAGSLEFRLKEPILYPNSGLNMERPKGNIEKAAFFVGSPRGNRSTSFRLVEYIMNRMTQRSIDTEVVFINRVSRKTPEWRAMIKRLCNKDLVFLAFPLYIDTFPSKMIDFLVEWEDELKTREEKPKLATIVNCGYPEASHCENVVESCALFAEKTKLLFFGGLVLPGGRGIGKNPIKEGDGKTATIWRALNLATEELMQGKPFSIQTKSMLGKPAMPSLIYRWGGHRMWRKAAKKFEQKKRMDARPYLQREKENN